MFLSLQIPFLVGSAAVDLAGEVVEVGPGVQKFKPGDKVLSILNFMVLETYSISLYYM